MGSDTKFRVFFSELETNNLIKILGDNISIRNIQLCSFIEEMLPKLFEECANKRVMVLNINNDRPYITAVVLLQDINASFMKPKEKNHFFKVTKVTFENGNAFKKWLLGKDYLYKVVHISKNKVKVALFNMRQDDEMTLAQVGAKINNIGNIAQYILVETAYKLEKCFE
jgi:hypothetical protein